MNPLLEQRLLGIQKLLLTAFDAGADMSAASKGFERETFVSLFLRQVLPPLYRFGTGDVTDMTASRSGQLDVVIEMPWAPSFALPIEGGARLYPAESVGVAIEVKSNVTSQWKEVARTATQLSPLRQKLGGTSVVGSRLAIHGETQDPIPLFAVGFEGWRTADPIERRLSATPIDEVLILRHLVYVETNRLEYYRGRKIWNDVRTRDTDSETAAACHRLFDLHEAQKKPAAIARTLNKEAMTTKIRNMRDGISVPAVESGRWTAEIVGQFVQLVGIHVHRFTGPDAMLRFVAAIHNQVGKRSGMSFDLTGYGGRSG